MNMGQTLLIAFCGVVLLGIAGIETVSSAEAPEIQVVKVSEADETAVVKGADGKMQLIKVGDSIGKNAKVTEISEGRVVIEEKNTSGVETVIIRLQNGMQQVERIRKMGDQQPVLLSPGAEEKKK